ncbi:chromosome loss-related protein [Paecilomyces lecythidis]
MARLKTVRAPTTASLPNSLRIPSTTPSLLKTLGKISRQSLLDLAFEWLDEKNVQSFPPFLERDQLERGDDEELNPYPAAVTVEDVRETYRELQSRKGGKREVIDRILEGDWRHGITLRQLAMADLRYVEDHPAGSHRWTALKLAPIRGSKSSSPDSGGDSSSDIAACIPRFHPSTFLQNLQREISPLVKAHYHIARSKSLPLTFLRIFITDSPYQYPRQPPEIFTDASRVVYVAFPDSSPFLYTSIAAPPGTKTAPAAAHPLATDTRTLQHILREAIPKALSRPHERYTLEPTSLTAKSLHALLALRGPGRTNSANGAFSIFADAVLEGSPLNPRASNTVAPEEYQNEGSSEKENEERNGSEEPSSTDTKTQQQTQTKKSNLRSTDSEQDPEGSKRRKLAVHSRFGTAGTPASAAALDRLDIRLLDPPVGEDEVPDETVDSTDAPTMTLTFHGSDVVSGLRRLAELGVADPERMPSWMTGEEAVSVAAVKGGRRIVPENER